MIKFMTGHDSGKKTMAGPGYKHTDASGPCPQVI